MRQWIGPFLYDADCPSCGAWSAATGPHAPSCALMGSIHQYEEDVRTGRAAEPGYWTTWEELQAKYPS